MIKITDKYNSLKSYIVEYKGEHYTIQQFICDKPVSKKLRLGLSRIIDITGKSEKIVKNCKL